MRATRMWMIIKYDTAARAAKGQGQHAVHISWLKTPAEENQANRWYATGAGNRKLNVNSLLVATPSHKVLFRLPLPPLPLPLAFTFCSM